MNVAKIAAAPILRMTGIRLPNSAQEKPPTANSAIDTEISDGTLPVATNPAINASKSKYTGNGTMPMRISINFHQPCGQNLPDTSSLAGMNCSIGMAFISSPLILIFALRIDLTAPAATDAAQSTLSGIHHPGDTVMLMSRSHELSLTNQGSAHQRSWHVRLRLKSH